MAGPANKAPQSFNDALGDVLMDITNASLAPDADMDFIEKLRQVVLGKLKHMGQSPGAQPGAAGGGAPAGGPPPGGPAAGPPPGGPQQKPPPPQGGPDPHASMPDMDPDEMRRVIAQSTGS